MTGSRMERTSTELVRDRTFGPFLAGRLLSSFALWIHNVVAVVVAFKVRDSSLDGALVTAAMWLPQLVLAPAAGRWTDSRDPARQIILGRSIAASGSGLLALACLVAGTDGPAVTLVALASLVVGVGGVVGASAMHAVLAAMVPRSELPRAINLNNLPFTLSRAVGPALGVLLLSVGPPIAFAVATAGQLSLVLVMQRVRRALNLRVTRPSGADVRVTAAWRHVRRSSRTGRLLLGVGALGAAADPSVTLGPALGHSLHAGVGLAGWFAASLGVGSVAGLCAIALLPNAALSPEPLACFGSGLMAAGLFVAAAGGPIWTVLVGFGCCGIGMALGLTGVSTLIQLDTPAEILGRVMALWGMAFLGSRPVAALAASMLAASAGLHMALSAVGLVVAVTAYMLRPHRLRLLAPVDQTI